MFDPSGFSLLLFGFLLGMKHALDADHVVALSTITTASRSLQQSCTVGVCWGLGHTAVLVMAGLMALALHHVIPTDVAQVLEAGVGVMLIGLGLSVGWTLFRERIHVHAHRHEDGVGHVHAHSHHEGPGHVHAHRYRLEYCSLAVGMMHGLAGSAAVLVVALPTLHSLTDGMGYLLAFGAGSIAGMGLLGAVLSLPLLRPPWAITPERLVRAHLALRVLAGLASVSLGGRMLHEFLAM